MKKQATSDLRGQSWSITSLALAVCASAALLVLPIYPSGYSQTTQVSGHDTKTTSEVSNYETLLQDGDTLVVLAMLLVPIVITAVPVLLRRHPRATASRVIAFGLLLLVLPNGYFTIGGFYLPSAIAMFVAAIREHLARSSDPYKPARSDAASK